ncbi:uncharacterized protein LOC143253686 [Tachypleus tridentatus]|uniref:uncharacterized protein LOC143253686 n=1 Tax=Tachypleus tridentatus TaxID=6853 RepID=UPI003FCF6FEB
MFCSDPTVLDCMGFKSGRLRLKKPSAVGRIVPTIFPHVDLRTELSLLRTGSTPLKPSLAITKRTNLKHLEESAADDTVPTSVEEVVIHPTRDDDCKVSRTDSFQSVSVQTLAIPSIPRWTQTG